MRMVGKEVPDWLEGQLLPPYHNNPSSLHSRSIYAMDSRKNLKFKIYGEATFAMIKENYKLIHYYKQPKDLKTYFELYDLENDPEELNDLYASKRGIV